VRAKIELSNSRLLTFVPFLGKQMQTDSSPKNTSKWLNFIKKTLPKSGQLSTYAITGTPIILEWQAYNPTSPECIQTIRNLSEIFIQTYTRQELEFARKWPEKVPTEMFLKDITPLFNRGVEHVNWKEAERHVRTKMEQFFATNDFAVWANSHDITIFVVAKNSSGGKLGAIQFSVTPDFEYGNVRAGLTGILSYAQHRGIEKLLMSSIFKLLPTTSRIFLHNRPTNEQALAMYHDWGFVPFAGTNADWPDFEYLTETTDILQKTALLMS